MPNLSLRRALVPLLALALFLLNGRLPNSFFSLERVNAAVPVANDDSYLTTAGTLLHINAPGILANDTDADGDGLSVDVIHVLGANHGSLAPLPDGSFDYQPGGGFSGNETFTYEVFDGTSLSNTATVTIHVDAPPVVNNDSYSTEVNTPLTLPAPGVLANDTDADNDPLTALSVSGVAHGSLTFNSNGSLIYTPNSGFAGTDSFLYRANDGLVNSNNLATVNIRVDSPPVALADFYATPLNQTLTVNVQHGVLIDDTDSDNDPLTAVLVSGASNGTLALNADGSFTYQANDGIANSTTATVTIFVGKAMPVANDDLYDALINTQLVVNVQNGVLSNDTDADGNMLTAYVDSLPTNGTLNLNADGSFTYLPNNELVLTDSFTYHTNDGTVNSYLATVTIHLSARPVAVGDNYVTNLNTALTVSAPGLLVNDTDADGDTLHAIEGNTPLHGTLTINPDGSFVYTPDTGFSGTDSFSYHVNDGLFNSYQVPVTIQVVAVSPPMAAPPRNFYTTPDVLLTWTQMNGAVGYQVQVSTSKTFANTPAADVTIPSGDILFADVSALTNGVYSWRMRVQLGANTWGAWKIIDSFTVAH